MILERATVFVDVVIPRIGIVKTLAPSLCLTSMASLFITMRRIRWWVRRKIGKRAPNALVLLLEDINRILHLGRNANPPTRRRLDVCVLRGTSRVFNTANKVSPYERHGNISSIQLLQTVACTDRRSFLNRLCSFVRQDWRPTLVTMFTNAFHPAKAKWYLDYDYVKAIDAQKSFTEYS